MKLHPDMMRLADHIEQQRREQDRRQALAASQASQAAAKRSNAEHDRRWQQQYGHAARLVAGG